MKIKIILKENKQLLNEWGRGKLFTVYHNFGKGGERFRNDDMLDSEEIADAIIRSGYRIGPGDYYGPGIYTVAKPQYLRDRYGTSTMRFAVNLDRFLIFELSVAQAVFQTLDPPPPKEQWEKMVGDPGKYPFKGSEEWEEFSGDQAKNLWKDIRNRGFEGMCFNGKNDGIVVVGWNPSIFIPTGWKLKDDQEFRTSVNGKPIREWWLDAIRRKKQSFPISSKDAVKMAQDLLVTLANPDDLSWQQIKLKLEAVGANIEFTKNYIFHNIVGIDFDPLLEKIKANEMALKDLKAYLDFFGIPPTNKFVQKINGMIDGAKMLELVQEINSISRFFSSRYSNLLGKEKREMLHKISDFSNKASQILNDENLEKLQLQVTEIPLKDIEFFMDQFEIDNEYEIEIFPSLKRFFRYHLDSDELCDSWCNKSIRSIDELKKQNDSRAKEIYKEMHILVQKGKAEGNITKYEEDIYELQDLHNRLIDKNKILDKNKWKIEYIRPDIW